MHNDSSKTDANAKRLSIFSVHVHPDGSRIATGGLDAKIRIWSTKPILNQASENSGRPPKSLCTLTMHTGPVLTVRWAHNGRWLASGSDDEIVMIWDLDPNARGKVWGSDEVNVEGWKPLKRLPGHESDVTDVAWSPADRYLASVGLDSKVIIWDGYTLESVRKLDQHQGFVKGVCWDPVGEFLATQSDDKTVKIWRTSDWSLEAEVTKPFEDSPGSTFFRRLSWSPDGAHITASNATNNQGFVFIAAVITRNTWTSDISLVGHENTIEVASYNPHIFLRNPSQPVTTSNICSVVALGADDRSVSVWQTKSARPLIVAKEVFDRQIMDLSWSWDGLTLYAASSDGTIAVFNFDPSELEGISPHSAQEQYLSKFGFSLPPPPHGYSHVAAKHPTPPPSPGRRPIEVKKTIVDGEQVNQLVARRGKAKSRVNLLPKSISAAVPSARGAQSQPSYPSSSRVTTNFGFFDPVEQPYQPPHSWARSDLGVGAPMDMDASFSGESRGKRKASAMIDLTDDGPDRTTGRTMGSDRRTEALGPAKQLGGWGSPSVHQSGYTPTVRPLLDILPLLSHLKSDVEEVDCSLEVRNIEVDHTTEVSFSVAKQVQWVDYLPSPVIAIKATPGFCAVASEDGTLNVYSHTGRRIFSPLALGSPANFMDGNKTTLICITSAGQLHSWNVKQQKANFAPMSIAPLLSSSPNLTILSVTVSPNGTPLIYTSDATVYTYDCNLLSYLKVTERWWAENSDAWHGRPRAPTSVRGIMNQTEHSLSNGQGGPIEPAVNASRPQWWSTAITLGHLESRIYAVKLMESTAEYNQAVLMYAKKISEEGFKEKAEELIRELFGPVFLRPGREERVSATICGVPRRDLLNDVLAIFARSKTLARLGMDWQETLRRAQNDDS